MRTWRRPAVLVPATAAAVTAVALVETLTDRRSGDPGVTGVAIALALGVSVLLAAHRPLVGLAVGVALFPLPSLLLGTPGPGGAQLIVVMGLVGYAAFRLGPRASAPGYAAAVVVPAVTLVVLGETSWEFLFFAVIIGLAWGTGVLLRRERERTAQLRAVTEQLRVERVLREEQVVTEERARISRELHDAVAHSMSVMTLQVGVVRRRLADRPVEHDALVGVEDLGRRSVDELRRIVGLVRSGPGDALSPAPSLARLDELVTRLEAADLAVRLHVEGTPRELPAALDASAYRVVQEALSNAVRHAPGAAVDVRVTWSPKQVRLEVVDDGPQHGLAHPPVGTSTGGGDRPGGHGLVGIRERVALFGGSLRVGPEGGGWAVRVDLPVPA